MGCQLLAAEKTNGRGERAGAHGPESALLYEIGRGRRELPGCGRGPDLWQAWARRFGEAELCPLLLRYHERGRELNGGRRVQENRRPNWRSPRPAPSSRFSARRAPRVSLPYFSPEAAS